jgi:hypothetical protein
MNPSAGRTTDFGQALAEALVRASGLSTIAFVLLILAFWLRGLFDQTMALSTLATIKNSIAPTCLTRQVTSI